MGTAAQLPPESRFDPAGYARLLRHLFVSRWSGSLGLELGGPTKRLHFSEGYIVFGSSSDAAERLGDVLLAKGIITPEQYDRSGQLIRETGKKQGTILVQIGALNPKELFRGLILQVTEIAISPFLAASGSYTLWPANQGQAESITLKVHPGAIIRDGMWRMASPANLSGLANTPFSRSASPPFAENSLPLSPLDRAVLAAVPEGKTPADLATERGLPLEMVTRAFYILANLGLINQTTERQARSRLTTRQPGAGTPAAAPTGEAILQKELLAMIEELPVMNHYQVLGIQPDASAQEIRLGYIRQARKYHPDRFRRPQLEDFIPLAEKVFSQVTAVYNAIATPASRGEYNRAIGMVVSGDEPSQGDLDLAAKLFSKGAILLLCDDLGYATEALRWAVRLAPGEPPYRLALAEALRREGRGLKEAAGHVEVVLGAHPDNAEGYFILGNVYRRIGQEAKAVGLFRKVLALDQQHQGAQRALSVPAAPPAPVESFLEQLFEG
jgi:tetratricopeptide (TPR) repeat protein